MPVDDAQHRGDQVDGKDIVGIREEAYASNNDGTNMIPTERSFVDFGKGETAT